LKLFINIRQFAEPPRQLHPGLPYSAKRAWNLSKSSAKKENANKETDLTILQALSIVQKSNSFRVQSLSRAIGFHQTLVREKLRKKYHSQAT
jgi:hypothetical protein